jgi:3-oxoacyl-[acyl-carrier-protein] synthase II
VFDGDGGADFITKFDASLFKTQFACEVKDFDPLSIMDRKEVRKLDPFSVNAMATAKEAIADSNIDLDKVDLYRAGVVWGSGIGGMKTFQEECFNYKEGDGTPRFNPFFVPKMIVDIAAGHISIKYGLKGPNYVTVSACASSTNALIDSLMLIQLGKCDFIVSGGSEAGVNIAGVGGFNALKALSTRNDNPKTASRPFDSTRDGFVLGEGSGCLILEELEHAKARGAKIYAEIVGYGATSDGYDMVQPSGEGAIRCMKQSLNLVNEKIDYINTHGTSTPVGDTKELESIKELFGEKIPYLSSTKSLTGHSLGATGAQEAIYCLIMMNNNFIAGSANIFDIDDKAKNMNILTSSIKDKTINTAMSNSVSSSKTKTI